jgi:probable phosphoglycerate mutase
VTRLLLLRHGQSTWNSDGRWQGQADPPLSPLGISQAQAAVGTLPAVAAVFTSDLVRAVRTAEILGGPAGLRPRLEARLRERHAGDWTGLTRVEIEERWPGYLAGHLRPPGYEDDSALLERALAALDAIARNLPGATVVAVSHGGLIRTVERQLGVDAPPLPNLGGRWVDLDGRTRRAGDRVLLVDPDRVEVTVPRSI